MSLPLSKPWFAPHDATRGASVASTSFAQEDTLRGYGSMPEFTRYALTRSTQHSLGYLLQERPADACVRWRDLAPPRNQTPTFADRVEAAARQLPAFESTENGERFLLDFLQACRERGVPLDAASAPLASGRLTVGDMRNDVPGPAAVRSRSLVDTLLASIRQQGRVLPLGHPAFHHTLAGYLPHMRRILETLAGRSVVPSTMEWQLADYTHRLGRVSEIVERQQLAGVDDFCRLFIEPEPNTSVARQQRDWDRRLAELPPGTSAEWQTRRRAAVALAPMLNPQVAQHLLAAMGTAGR